MFIDLHSHVFTPGMLGTAGEFGPEIYFDEKGYHHIRVGNWEMVQSTPETLRRVAAGWTVDTEELMQVATSPANRIEKMNLRGYDKIVVSMSLHFVLYHAPADLGIAYARKVNDDMARYCSHDPDRLMFWAHVPLQAPDDAAKEADRAIRELGAKGIMHGGAHIGGLDPDDEQYFPLYEVMCKHDLPIFVHGHTEATGWGGMGGYDKYEATTAVGFTHNETLFFYNIIAGGVLDRFPDLKIYITHGGGFVPYHLGRLEAMMHSTADVKAKKPLRDYLGNFWFDLELESKAMRRAVVEDVGASQLLYGDNFPGTDGIWEQDLLADLGLNPDEKEAILWKNASKLLRIAV